MRARCVTSLLFAFFLSIFASMVQGAATFGPKQYLRSQGPTQSFTDTFSPCGAGACQLVVVNGNPDGSARVSSASVFLNGVELVGVRNLNQRVERLAFPVTLLESNEVRVELGSAPGSFLTVTVECADQWW